jgi:KaiC/GvpD/RAD55 family RecA-like ATPase
VSKESTIITIDSKMKRPKFKLLDYALAEDLDPDSTEFADELVEGLLAKRSISVLYGDSNSGKTFLAIDLGAAVARQLPWMQRNIDGGMVVYLATESPESVRNRLRAYQKHHGVKIPNFIVVSTPINLYENPADAAAIVNMIQTIEVERGCKCELVIGDTLARMSAGANENSGEHMGMVLAQLDRVKTQGKTAVAMIHHTGKNAAMGMRGWSGMRAFIDTELEVTTSEASSDRVLEITKQRDIGGKGDRFGFRLDTVAMGLGKWGKERTSCVVVPANAPIRAPKSNAKMGQTQQAVMALLRGAERNMRITEIAEALKPQGVSKTSVYNSVERLRDAGLVEVSTGLVHLNGGKS